MSWNPPGHIDPKLWAYLSKPLQDLCIEAHALLEEGSEDAQLAALRMCPFGLICDEFGLMHSERREDYPQLDDAAYANFRMVSMAGIAPGKLYRSSSPIWIQTGRQTQAFACAQAAGIRTAIDIADTSEQAAQNMADAGIDTLPWDLVCIPMTMFFKDDQQCAKFAQLVRALIEHEPPYLLHCMEGQDRTGYICGVLECALGATLDQVVADYLETYRNYYNIPTTGRLPHLFECYFLEQLSAAFEVPDMYALEAAGQLEQTACSFLRGLGISAAELDILRRGLGSFA